MSDLTIGLTGLRAEAKAGAAEESVHIEGPRWRVIRADRGVVTHGGRMDFAEYEAHELAAHLNFNTQGIIYLAIQVDDEL